MNVYRAILFLTAALLALTTLNALRLPNGYVLLVKSVAMGLARYSAYYHRHKSWLTAAGMLSLALFVAPWNFIQVDTKSGNYISLMVGAVFVRLAINMRPTTSQSNKQNRSSSVP